ncbi:MAG: hypothetical protein BWY76_01069 [bacterium ADurb.Bin429]|nr:MAG: hypothetical protein BWY76_01069 [bacterium ADurb.Bin429]
MRLQPGDRLAADEVIGEPVLVIRPLDGLQPVEPVRHFLEIAQRGPRHPAFGKVEIIGVRRPHDPLHEILVLHHQPLVKSARQMHRRGVHLPHVHRAVPAVAQRRDPVRVRRVRPCLVLLGAVRVHVFRRDDARPRRRANRPLRERMRKTRPPPRQRVQVRRQHMRKPQAPQRIPTLLVRHYQHNIRWHTGGIRCQRLPFLPPRAPDTNAGTHSKVLIKGAVDAWPPPLPPYPPASGHGNQQASPGVDCPPSDMHAVNKHILALCRFNTLSSP